MSVTPASCRSSQLRRVFACVSFTFVLGTLSALAHGQAASPDDRPSLGEPVRGAERKPVDEGDLRYWMTNMIAYHGFSLDEASAATGMSVDSVRQTIRRFKLEPFQTEQPSGDRLVVVPYPGGRHPRIGFLDGAIRPQRETKFSVFLPWDKTSYVVADIPEAIWSNLGLTYLAHTHIDTVWDKQEIQLEPLEWQRLESGELVCQRELPNGIRFGTQVRPQSDGVLMRMWMHNGTDQPLSDLRVQNCIMLKAAKGFADQTNENKVLRGAYVASRDDSGERWIITAWQPIHRGWANAPCPCLHADPRFPDLSPGETRQLVGWLSFYEGKDIDTELNRLRSKRWETAWMDESLPGYEAPQPVDR